jgi:hypothetical protein
MPRKNLNPTTFSAGDGPHSAFVFTVRVHGSGFLEYKARIRMATHRTLTNRGNGISVPYGFVNMPTFERVPGPRFAALKRQTSAKINRTRVNIPGSGGRNGRKL